MQGPQGAISRKLGPEQNQDLNPGSLTGHAGPCQADVLTLRTSFLNVWLCCRPGPVHTWFTARLHHLEILTTHMHGLMLHWAVCSVLSGALEAFAFTAQGLFSQLPSFGRCRCSRTAWLVPSPNSIFRDTASKSGPVWESCPSGHGHVAQTYLPDLLLRIELGVCESPGKRGGCCGLGREKAG